MNKAHYTGKVSKSPVNVSKAKSSKAKQRTKKLRNLLSSVRLPK